MVDRLISQRTMKFREAKSFDQLKYDREDESGIRNDLFGEQSMRVHRTIIMNDRDTLDMKRDKAIFSHNGACVMAIKDGALAGITLLKDIAIFFECTDSLVIRNLIKCIAR